MLKKIRVDEVQLGMHIKEFCGSWMDHPFWRGQFVITDPKDLDKIRASKVREVMIDTDKGIDTPANAAAAPADPAPTVDEQAEAMEQVVKYDRPAHVPRDQGHLRQRICPRCGHLQAVASRMIA
jgi:hypothetical protein